MINIEYFKIKLSISLHKASCVTKFMVTHLVASKRRAYISDDALKKPGKKVEICLSS